jgi:hypothetical protein
LGDGIVANLDSTDCGGTRNPRDSWRDADDTA